MRDLRGRKVYLGDAVYATVEERGIVLTTENGLAVTNEIVLEPGTLVAFEAFIQAVREQLEQGGGR